MNCELVITERHGPEFIMKPASSFVPSFRFIKSIVFGFLRKRKLLYGLGFVPEDCLVSRFSWTASLNRSGDDC